MKGKVFEIPVVTGSEQENALDISKLRGAVWFNYFR